MRAGQVCVQRTIGPTSPRESLRAVLWLSHQNKPVIQWLQNGTLSNYFLLEMFCCPSNTQIQINWPPKESSNPVVFLDFILELGKLLRLLSVSRKSSLNCSRHSVYQHQCQQVKVTTVHQMTRAHPRMRVILTRKRNSPFFSTTPGMSTLETVQSSHLTSRISLWYP